jgi:hypothetical protein
MVPIQCQACGATTELLRVTASLRCGHCNSDDLDLYDGQKTANQGQFNFMNHGRWPNDEGHNTLDDQDDAYEDGYAEGLKHDYIPEGHPGINPTIYPQDEIDAFRAGHRRANESRRGIPGPFEKGYTASQSGQKTAKNASDAEEAHSGECWTCSRDFLKRSDLVDHVRTEHNREPLEKQSASSGTGWGHQTGDPLKNWNEYAGPQPGPNPQIKQRNDADDSGVCQVCHGTGKTSFGGGGYEEEVCRNCHGTGRTVYPTGQPQNESFDAHVQGPIPGGAGWVGRTSARVDGKDTAVKFKVLSGPSKTAAKQAKIAKMAKAICKNNSGLSEREARKLAERAVEKFPEA